MQTGIRIFDFQISPEDRIFLHHLVDQIADEGYLTNHTLVKKVESEFASWTNTQYLVAVNNGSSALTAALGAIPRNNGRKKVLLPSNTFIACWLAIVQAGYEPVLIDLDSSFLGFDLNQIHDHILTNQVAAILLVHIGGIIDPKIDALVSLCAKNNILLIEDAAHAHGSHYKGRLAGSIGDIATFSFHLTKAITSGEGGLISTINSAIYKNLLSIRQFGKSENNPHLFEQFGGNFKMSEMQAAFLLMDLRRAKKRIERRQEIAKIYFEQLNNSRIFFLKPDQGSESSCYKCMALLPAQSREKLIAKFLEYNIQLPNGVYYWPLHRQPIVNSKEKIFLNTDAFSERHICLPCYPELTDEQVFYFVDIFKRCESEGLV